MVCRCDGDHLGHARAPDLIRNFGKSATPTEVATSLILMYIWCMRRRAFQDYEGSKDHRPIIGMYTCIICERSFSTMARLKRHYCRIYGDKARTMFAPPDE
jgi:hypothetical protein